MITLKRLKELEKLSYEEGHFYPQAKKIFKPETIKERKEITSYWKTLRGNTCYWDAIRELIYNAELQANDFPIDYYGEMPTGEITEV